MWLRHKLKYVIDLWVPADLLIYEQMTSIIHSQALYAFVSLGLVDALRDTPRPVASLARHTHVQEDKLKRLLRLLAAQGFIRIDQRGWVHLRRRAKLLDGASKTSLSPFVRYFGHPDTVAACSQMSAVIQKGQDPYVLAHSANVWQHFANHPDQKQEFSAAMRSLTALEQGFIVHSDIFRPASSVCDVGGSDGQFVRGLLHVWPLMQATVYDLPSVIELTQRSSESDAEPRLRFEGGDFFHHVPPGHDMYVLRNILHDWDDKHALKILRQIQKSMPVQGRLVVIEMPLGQMSDSLVSLVDMVMMVATSSGRQRSKSELDALLGEAGFMITQWRNLPSCSALAVAEVVHAT